MKDKKMEEFLQWGIVMELTVQTQSQSKGRRSDEG